ncbi:MAG: dephospho-CoA kinase [Candidatus Marinimicrobia bacterium]|jgi:dephospho-CoA kinase|nr:dephospho-CoA kinase [Candidatus Neomarinimicrobiota bacterium]MBT3496379.1 dephospho-CoA kinase [Candidatus Neomarinimicrobiota bacterium]MBT3692622.1 dephospho-CoA kinase [Candidatus Neomarinimicrobiota bacterium]MBT3732264.1 dephospho-CoA kinase [Candidatus Neomarinimicrobiota bacterium]MBT4143702.1 dephospho-CoA kinase [Candidatus Neomarinimicrobiota bacterium]
MIKIGLTGGIGSGKSLVSQYFKELGAYIFDADFEAKKILDTNATTQYEIIAEFGTDILNAENKIDKKKLAKIAFQDEDHQSRLNTLIHPYVFDEIDSQFEKIANDNIHKVFVLDAALIYESGANTHMDYIVVVSSHLKLRVSRVMERGGLSRDEFMKRMKLQWTEEDKIHMADFIILNNASEEDLKKNTLEVFNQIF